MATINAIYKIAADISSLERGVAQGVAAMQKLEKSVAAQTTIQEKLASTAGKLGAALAGAFTVAAITNATKQVIDFASHLTDLSQKTGISTSGLQKLQLAFEQSGISLDTVTAATTKLAKNLVDGDKSTVGALTKLGLSVGELKKMAPEQQFIAVADAIGRIQNPTEKAYAAMAVFGRGGAELLAGLDGQLQATTDKFAAMGVIIDQQTVKAADDFGDQLTVLQKVGMAFVAQVLGPLLPGLAQLAQWLMTVATGAIDLGRSVEDWLIQAWMQAEIAYGKFLLRVAEGSQQIPLLGKYIGASADTVKSLRENVTTAELQLKLFSTRTAEVGDHTQKARPPVIGLGKDTEDAAARARKAAEAFKQLVAHIREIEGTKAEFKVLSLADALSAIGGTKAVPTIKDVGAFSLRSATDVDELRGSTEDLQRAGRFLSATVIDVNKQIGVLPNVTAQATAEIKDATKASASWADTLRGTLGDALGGLNDIFQRAFEGGGGVKGAIQSFATNIVSGLTSMIPIVGPVISQFAGAIVAGVKKIFGGVSQEELNARQAVQNFEKQLASTLSATQRLEAGGEQWKMTVIAVRDAYLKAGMSAAQAEAAVKQLWDSSKLGADATKAAIDQINQVLQDNAHDQERAKQLIDEYHLSIDQLGPAFRAQQLGEQARSIMDDFRVMVNVLGIDAPVAMDLMKDKINAFVQSAIKTGTEVPASMKPMLEQMVSLGLLTDGSGNKITDLKDSGITFAETFGQGVDRIIQKFDQLMERLGLVPKKIAEIPTSRDIDVNVRYHDDPRTFDGEYAARGGFVRRTGIQYLAEGGTVLPFTPRGTDSVPAMLTPGEGVVNTTGMDVLGREGLRALNHGRRGEVVDMGAVRAELQAVRTELANQRREAAAQARRMPEQLAIATRDALIQAGIARR